MEDPVNDDKGLPAARVDITVVTQTGRSYRRFSAHFLELNPARMALLKRLVGEETWNRSRGFKQVNWSEVEESIAQTFPSRKPTRRKTPTSKGTKTTRRRH
jgi:hypothetical protein